MSLIAYSKTWESSKADGSDLLVLLALADYAKDDGTGAYGTNERMAKKARLKTIRGLQLIYQRLQEGGELLVEYGAGPLYKGQPTNLYHLIYQDGTNEGAINYIKARMEGVNKSSSPRQGVKRGSSRGVKHSSPHKDKRDSETSAVGSAKASPPATRGGKSGQRKLFPGAPGGADLGDLRTRKQAKHEKLDIGLLRAGFRLCYLTSGAHGEPPVSDKQAGQVAQTFRALIGNGVTVTPERVAEFQLWWAGNYRSKVRGQEDVYKPPLPRQVQELWAEAIAARKNLTAACGGAPDPVAAAVDDIARKRVDEAMAAHAAVMRGGQHD
jgi:hypothetical protein